MCMGGMIGLSIERFAEGCRELGAILRIGCSFLDVNYWKIYFRKFIIW